MKKMILSIMVTGVLFSASRWELLHYEVTDNGLVDVSAVDSMNVWFIGVRNDIGGIIYKTQDGGATWQELHPWTIEEGVGVFSIQFLDLNTGYVTSEGLIYNIFLVSRVLKTTDGGNTWTTVYGGNLASIGRAWYDIFFVDYNNGWAVGYKSDIIHTSDGGNNWSSQNAPDTSYKLQAVYFLNQNEGWIVGGDYDTTTGEGINGVVLHTTNGGNTWVVQIDSAPFELCDVYFINSQKGFACGYKDASSPGLILKTEDGGNTWNIIMAPEVSLGYYGLYGIEFIDEFTGFAAGAGEIGLGSRKYFAVFLKTNDGGNTWNVDTVIYENEPWGVAPICLDMASKNWGFAGGARFSVFRYAPYQDIEEKPFAYNNRTRIFYSKNGLILKTSDSFNFKIVDASGRILLKGKTLKNGESFIPLKQGVYHILFNSPYQKIAKKFVVIK